MQIVEKELDAEQNVGTEILDMLDRQPFVDQLISVVDILSVNKKNVCFALNGPWGVGKSFVLKMFEDQIARIQTPETTMGKYILFHYDCWKYDYYEEPLMAIVAALLDSIDEQVHLFSNEQRTRIKGILKVLGIALVEKVNERIEEEIGLNPKNIWDFVAGVSDEAVQKIEESHSFDTYFDFNRILRKLRETINSLAQDQTVIIVVDELDRCLPKYTIKVLERLHHVFDGIPNVQMILSIDKGQLEHTVKQIYGIRTDVKKYLEKFISFEVTLPVGSLNDQTETFFENYYSQFDNIANFTTSYDVAEFKRVILEGVNTRSRIAIIEKCNLLHSIISKGNVKSDVVFMCVEMFLTVLKFYDLNVSKAKNNFNFPTLFDADQTCNNKNTDYTLPGLVVIREKYKSYDSCYSNNELWGAEYISVTQSNRTIVTCDDLWGVLLACYRTVLGFAGDSWQFSRNHGQEIKQYTLDFWKLLKTIA